jgi:hypothetical protein
VEARSPKPPSGNLERYLYYYQHVDQHDYYKYVDQYDGD